MEEKFKVGDLVILVDLEGLPHFHNWLGAIGEVIGIQEDSTKDYEDHNILLTVSWINKSGGTSINYLFSWRFKLYRRFTASKIRNGSWKNRRFKQ